MNSQSKLMTDRRGMSREKDQSRERIDRKTIRIEGAVWPGSAARPERWRGDRVILFST